MEQSQSQNTLGASTPSIPVVFPSCRLQIEWANTSTRMAEEFELVSGPFGEPYVLIRIGIQSKLTYANTVK